ncbi:MAG: 1,4-alpha-glucan branching protein GlgB, partial [Chitinophagaceae bacterium]|nr:1,4-alpha-glucan branching protein GlgB [Chitinophagaceae bacterium]
KFANLRLMYTYMFAHPGGKLLFMGNEFGVTNEWNYKSELQWDLLQFPAHKGVLECVKSLAGLLKSEPALYENQFNQYGFEWVDLNHRSESVIVFKRKGKDAANDVLVVLNMTPVVRNDWSVHVQGKKNWSEIFNSNEAKYWGTGDVFNPQIEAKVVDEEAGWYELSLNLPALGAILLR